MKPGKNINGGSKSWSTEAIREIAKDGLPLFEISVIADNGDTVTWDPNTGEVRTVIKASNIIDIKGQAA